MKPKLGIGTLSLLVAKKVIWLNSRTRVMHHLLWEDFSKFHEKRA